MISAEELAFVQQVAARDLLGRAARICEAAAVPAMALKGLWLLEAILPPSSNRPVADVDLLVRPADYRRARRAFRGAGFVETAADPRQVSLRLPGDPLGVDLHRALFDRGSFALSADDLFARSTDRRAIRGAPVWLPDPRDGFAHLTGHATHCRLRLRDAVRMEDFEAIAQAAQLDPCAMARHLEATGMRRAARYVLSAVDGPFCGAVRAALRPDPLGSVLAEVCTRMIPKTDPRRRAGGVLSYLLEDSLATAGRAMFRRARIVAAQEMAQRVRRT